jgi:zinc protease
MLRSSLFTGQLAQPSLPEHTSRTRFGFATGMPATPAIGPVNGVSGAANPPGSNAVLAFQAQSPAGFPLAMYVLGNGHRVLIEQRPTTDVVSLRTFIKTGSINENPVYNSRFYPATGSPSGIAHLDEHCHFLTTEHFTRPYSWTEKLSDYGSDFNASTSMELIQHELLANTEDLPTMLAMHAEAVLKPYYQPDLISKEKTNVINEIGERSRPAFAKIHNELMKLMFERPDFQTHGRLDDIKKTTVEDLKLFQQRWYRPSNMLTVLTGNVNIPQTLAMINKQFGQTPPDAQPPVSRQIQLTLPGDKAKHAVLKLPDLVQPMMLMGFPAPPRTHARDRMAMTFIQVLLGGGPSSMLQESLKTQQRVVSDVSVNYEPNQGCGCLEIALDTPPGQEFKATQGLLQEIQQLRTQPVSPAKLQELKGRIINSFNAALERAEVSTLSMGEEAAYQSLGYYLNFPKLVEATTAQDIQRVALQYLNPKRFGLVMAYPQTGAASGGKG